jgi:energy-coupling factor transport system ATP-binding protein
MGLGPEVMDLDPDRLSFGERRRVALASVIALKPDYLVLDEPLAGLDWYGRRRLVEAIRGLKAQGVTVIILTHESDLVAEVGDVVWVVKGKSVSGPVPVAQFVLDPGTTGESLLPDYVRVMRRISGHAKGVVPVPVRVEDVADVIIRLLEQNGCDI